MFIVARQNKENVEKKVSGSFTQSHIRIRRQQGYAAAEKLYMSKCVELCCVEGCEVQGMYNSYRRRHLITVHV